jgi:REP element-mobilizing transposase RayT
MPDHVHLLVSAAEGKNPLDTAACFKRLTTIAVRSTGFTQTLWQRRIHDRGLRTAFGNDLHAALRYVLDNPVRRQLVDSWDQWPLSYINEHVRVSL